MEDINKIIKYKRYLIPKIIGMFFLTSLIIIFFLVPNNSLKPEYINNRSNICICMWYDDGVKEYANLAREINKRYCEIHKYDFIYDNERRLKNRDPTWECIPCLLNAMKKNNYEYVVWIDADAFFRVKHENDLMREIINSHNDKYLILSEDIDGKDIMNAGFMVIKNNEYTRKLLNDIINSDIPECRKYKEIFHEQECICHLYRNNIYNTKDNSVILPFGELQTFNPKENETSLIIHLAGWNREERIKTIEEFKKKYNV